jgi:hypothetical protein
MSDRTIHGATLVAMAASSAVGVVLGLATINGMPAVSAGDLFVASNLGAGLNLALLLVGSAVLVTLEAAHVSVRRPRPRHDRTLAVALLRP